MLGYYGTVLGAIITVVTLVATITFTKKQITVMQNGLMNRLPEDEATTRSACIDMLGEYYSLVAEEAFSSPDLTRTEQVPSGKFSHRRKYDP